MINNNIFVEKKGVETGLLAAITKLESNIDRIELAINQNRTYLQKDSYQLLVNIMNPENSWERILFSELLTTCFQLELKCHGSSIYFLRAFSLFAKEYHKKEGISYNLLVEHNQEERKKYLDKIMNTCFPARQIEVEDVIDSVSNNNIIATTTKEAIALAGVEGNIVMEEGDVSNIIVELQFGYNFSVDPFNGFIPQFGTWTRRDIKVLLIDGMIERVSELDKILSKSWETKIPLMIIAQSFSEEVIATLYNNTARGGFDIIPVRLQQSLEALNMLNDIGVVCGCDVISTLKGEVVSCVDYDSLPIIQKATITGKVLTVHNNDTRPQVLSHLHYLSERRTQQAENTTVSDLADLTSRRISNLLTHLVKITLPRNDASQYKGTIDNAIRAARSIYTYGFCDPSKVNLDGLDKLWVSVHSVMQKSAANQNVPSICFYLASGYAADLAAAYFTSAGAVIVS